MAQEVECLPYNCEALNSNSSIGGREREREKWREGGRKNPK
jgi:hypothetical protein